jgi:hypothetical protein
MLWAKVKLALIVLVVAVAGAGLWACAAAGGPASGPSPRRASLQERAVEGLGIPRQAQRPVGVWQRQAGSYRLRLRVDHDHVCATLVDMAREKPLWATLEADYGVTTDSVLYGVITSVEASSTTGRTPKGNDWMDQPFSVHFRVDDHGLTVKNLKFMGGQGGDLADVIQGRYTKADAGLSAEKDKRLPLLPAGATGGPPDEAEVLRALPRLPASVPYLYEVFRDDVRIVSERLRTRVDPPRFFPLIGRARLHCDHWKCKVAYTQIEQSSYPIPFQRKVPRVEVVYIDKEYLELAPE